MGCGVFSAVGLLLSIAARMGCLRNVLSRLGGDLLQLQLHHRNRVVVFDDLPRPDGS